MLSPTSRQYLLIFFKLAHMTYQSPVVWERKKKIFTLDESRNYRYFSYGVICGDILNFFLALYLLILNHEFGLSHSFSLFLGFLLMPTVGNVCLDIDSLARSEETVQFLNIIWKHVQSPSGIHTNIPFL